MTVIASRRGDRLTESVSRICAVARPPSELLAMVSDLLRPVLRHTAGGWLVTDPDNLIGNPVHTEGCSDELHLALLAQEVRGDDFNLLHDVARGQLAATSLTGATGGDLHRSRRWREVYRGAGYGDELRGAFVFGGDVWGTYTVVKTDPEPFGPEVLELMRRVGPEIAAGLRVGLLVPGVVVPDHDGPGVVIVGDGGEVRSMTDSARRLLASLPDPSASPAPAHVLHEVATRALARSAGTTTEPAVAHVQTPEGWLSLFGAVTGNHDDEVAVVVEAIPPARVRSLLFSLHRVSGREREVAHLLLRGASIEGIATQLWISVETVRGHVKGLFQKLGVRSRPELTALLCGSASDAPRPTPG